MDRDLNERSEVSKARVSNLPYDNKRRTPQTDRSGVSPTGVTAILPNYNHSNFIVQAIASFLNQSSPPDEIIVIDDASTDNSVAVIEALAREVPTLRLIRHRTNRGAIAAQNRGLEEARGRYVYLGAADDLTHPI